MEHGKILFSVSQLATGARVALFGAGDNGVNFTAYLRKKRPDVRLVRFIDQSVTGNVAGVNVVSPAQHFADRDAVDLIIITIYGPDKAEAELKDAGIDAYLKVNQHLFPATKQTYLADEMSHVGPNLAQARALLATPEDRALFDLIVDCRSAGFDAFDRFKAGFTFKGTQYLDYIQRSAIRTLVSGGIWDGHSTLRFLDNLDPQLRIIGFEPFYENYLASANAARLQSLANVHIEPLGLWKHRNRMYLETRLDGSSAIAKGALRSVDTKVIEVVALDDYVAEHGIAKVDYLKLDVESAEPEVLTGGIRTLRTHRPQLAISIYHRKEQVYEVPLLLSRLLDDYVYRLGHYNPATPFEETVIYGIPRELL